MSHKSLLFSFLMLLCLVGLEPRKAHADPETKLTLTRARQLASSRNLDVLLGKLDVQLARLDLDVAHRPFVPILRADARWLDQPGFGLGPQRNRSINYGASVDWATAWGTQFDAAISATEFFTGAGFGPVPSASFNAGVTQPLWQGGWGEGNTLDLTQIDIQVQKALFLEQLNAFLVDVDQAYWNLALAQADMVIKRKSVARAKKQFEDTRSNIQRGLLAPGEIYLVEDNLVFFTGQLVRSNQTLKLAQASLARLLFLKPGAELVAVDKLQWGGNISLEGVVQKGLQNNPSLAAQQWLLKRAKERIGFDENQIAPRLDLNARAGLTGTDEAHAEAWSEVAKAQSPTWQVGVVFEIPLNRAPDYARVERAEVQQKRAGALKKQIELNLSQRLYQVKVQLEQGQELLKLSQRNVELSLKKLEVEQKKYQSGLSTLFNVVRFQRDLDDARIGEQRAAVSLLILKARLAALQGTLWADSGLSVQ